MNAHPAASFFECALWITTNCIIDTNKPHVWLPTARMLRMESPETGDRRIQIVALRAALKPCVQPASAIIRIIAKKIVHCNIFISNLPLYRRTRL
jgi:hypothetical protein